MNSQWRCGGKRSVRNLAATDGVNHFDLIALFEHRVCVLAARDDVQIQLNRHPTARQLPKRQKACGKSPGSRDVRFMRAYGQDSP